MRYSSLILAWLTGVIFGLHCTQNNPVDVQKASRIAHESRISQDETWSSRQEHIIVKDVLVQNATLTIEPGSVIKFQPGTSLKIQSGGKLVAKGSASDSIFFTNTKADSPWAQLEFETKSAGAQLNYCVIENGGSDSLDAMVVFGSGQISCSHSTIRGSQSNGLKILKSADLLEFKNNKIRENLLAPVLAPASQITHLGAENSFTGNGIDGIRVIEGGEIAKSTRWKALDVPYRFAVNFKIQEFELTLAPGVKIHFEALTRLTVGYKGGLLAAGAADSVIEFSGTESQPGFWQGIYLAEGNLATKIRFAHCLFSDGGSTPFQYADGVPLNATVFGAGGEPEFSNCRFENSSGYGVIFTQNCQPSDFSQNTISRNHGPALRICPEALSALQENRIYDNSENIIEITAGNLTRATTIRHNQVPFRLLGEINIYYETVTIEPGTAFELNSSAALAVAAGGALVADGIARGSAITFSGIVKQPGAWRFIYFGRDSNAAASRLNHCVLEYGGGDLRWPAMIYLEGVSPQITNCQIAFSRHWGIFKSNNAAPNLMNTIFFGNYDGDVWP